MMCEDNFTRVSLRRLFNMPMAARAPNGGYSSHYAVLSSGLLDEKRPVIIAPPGGNRRFQHCKLRFGAVLTARWIIVLGF